MYIGQYSIKETIKGNRIVSRTQIFNLCESNPFDSRATSKTRYETSSSKRK